MPVVLWALSSALVAMGAEVLLTNPGLHTMSVSPIAKDGEPCVLCAEATLLVGTCPFENLITRTREGKIIETTWGHWSQGLLSEVSCVDRLEL